MDDFLCNLYGYQQATEMKIYFPLPTFVLLHMDALLHAPPTHPNLAGVNVFYTPFSNTSHLQSRHRE